MSVNSDTSISMGIYEKFFFLVFQVYRKCEYISMKLLGIQLIKDNMKESRATLRHFKIFISNIHQSATENYNQSVLKLRNKY